TSKSLRWLRPRIQLHRLGRLTCRSEYHTHGTYPAVNVREHDAPGGQMVNILVRLATSLALARLVCKPTVGTLDPTPERPRMVHPPEPTHHEMARQVPGAGLGGTPAAPLSSAPRPEIPWTTRAAAAAPLSMKITLPCECSDMNFKASVYSRNSRNS